MPDIMEGLLTVHYSQQYASDKKKNEIVDISRVWKLQSSLITFTMGTRLEPHGANIAHCVVLLIEKLLVWKWQGRLVMQAISADNDPQIKQWKKFFEPKSKNMALTDNTITFNGKYEEHKQTKQNKRVNKNKHDAVEDHCRFLYILSTGDMLL